MSEVLTCVEHQVIPVRMLRQPGEFALSAAQARQLSQARGLPKDSFRWGHQEVRCRQYCGVVQLEGLTLEILPKIHGKETDFGSCRQALIRMLRKAGLMKLHRGAGAAVAIQQHVLLDVFIQEFCLLLNEQLLSGKSRDYRQRDDNLGVIKGKLLVNQQLRINLHHRERLYCQFDELTDDILLNRIIKYTLQLLLPKCRSSRVRNRLMELLVRFGDISDQCISTDDFRHLSLNRTSQRYSIVLDWCRLFILGRSPDVMAGEQPLLAILFDMNVLFERWLAAVLRPKAHQVGLTVREQSPRKWLAYREDLEQQVFQTKPDISLLDAEGHVIKILDAKWKLLLADESKLGISQQDLYQLSAYANLYSINRIGIVYPRQGGLNSYYQLTLPGREQVKLDVHCVDLDVDAETLESMLSLDSRVFNLGVIATHK